MQSSLDTLSISRRWLVIQGFSTGCSIRIAVGRYCLARPTGPGFWGRVHINARVWIRFG